MKRCQASLYERYSLALTTGIETGPIDTALSLDNQSVRSSVKMKFAIFGWQAIVTNGKGRCLATSIKYK